MHRFVFRLVHMGFVVDRMALGQGFLQVLKFSPVSISSILPTHSFHLSPMLCSLKQLTRIKITGQRSKDNIKTDTTGMGCGDVKGFIWLRR
jgi:hypothetical protein